MTLHKEASIGPGGGEGETPWAAEGLSFEGSHSRSWTGRSFDPWLPTPWSPRTTGPLDERFWFGALAIEMVHEASLLHDDILDEAPQRRGKPTMAAAAGVGPALVLGDHLLTGAYRAAAATGFAGVPERLHPFGREDGGRGNRPGKKPGQNPGRIRIPADHHGKIRRAVPNRLRPGPRLHRHQFF